MILDQLQITICQGGQGRFQQPLPRRLGFDQLLPQGVALCRQATKAAKVRLMAICW